jgi:hypothetical protein
MENFDLEKIIYEGRPYFYALAAIFCLANASNSKILLLSGILLSFSGLYVIKLRRDYRAQNRKPKIPVQSGWGHG